MPLSIPWTMIPVLVAETLGSPEAKYHVTGTADVTAVRALEIEKNDYPIEGTNQRGKSIVSARWRPMTQGPV